MSQRTYVAIDLKSYYASLETIERGLDPLTTNLVVADPSRTAKTICLAVSPALRSFGIPGRPRLFQVIQKVKEINARRLQEAIRAKRAVRDENGRWAFSGKSADTKVLASDPSLALDFLVAPPQMAHYMECSGRIYQIYLKYVAPEDIHVYSIDEVFMDITDYLPACKMDAHELTKTMIRDVLSSTGITATAGIGTNLYLAKAAMDIVAKHVEPDQDGVRIAQLDELSYRKLLWTHEPLTDFWRVGNGYAKKLRENGLFTMGDIARCSLGKSSDFYNEDLLYRLFGVNAELLIDHAWGYEPCTIRDIKSYRPENNSIGSGQVLTCPYDFEKAKLVVREMTDLLALELVDKGLVSDQLVLTVGYDIENLTDEGRKKEYHGPIVTDRYGRQLPKPAHGTGNLKSHTSSSRLLTECVSELYDRIVDRTLLIRRISIFACHVVPPHTVRNPEAFEQLNLFTDYAAKEAEAKREKEELEREHQMQKTMLEIKKKFGKNAVLKGMNLEEGATARNRNRQIGGHKA